MTRKALSSLAENQSSIHTELQREFLTLEQLQLLGRNIAERSEETSRSLRQNSVYERLLKSERSLAATYFRLAEIAEQNVPLPSGADWILDNFHVIEDHIREFKQHLPRKFYRTLPRTIYSGAAPQLRVQLLAEQFLVHRDHQVEVEPLGAFIRSFQEISPLLSGELWALPTLLRLALVERIKLLGQQMLARHDARQIGDEIARSVLSAETTPATDLLIALAERIRSWPQWKGVGALSIVHALRSHGMRTSLALHWLEERFKEHGLDAAELMRVDQNARAADIISIGNCITSLRFITNLDWTNWFESLSPVDRVLAGDPDGVYQRCDFKTRDGYRHEIEGLARYNHVAEVDVAAALIEIATETSKRTADARVRHIGYYLLDEGRSQFEKQFKFRSKRSISLRNSLTKFSLFLYLGAIGSVAGLLSVPVARDLIVEELPPLTAAGLYLLFLIIATEVATAIVQWFVSKISYPRALPKLDFEKGVPADCRCVVAIQAIFNDTAAIDRIAESIEVRFLGNDDPHISFALLADLPDACMEVTSRDEVLIRHAAELIEGLNQRHCDGRPQRFVLFFRARSFNKTDTIFMGWERKRGKVEELNEYLLGSTTTSLEVYAGDGEALRGSPYVLTLDSDTQLPRGSAGRLLGTIAHPLNRAVIDEKTNSVIAGYTILQPRIGVSLISANASPYARMFCGNAGIDPYTSLVSDVYQDLFGEGSYIGKGVYDVRAFHRVLGEKFPENQLLSHDLIEGIYARTALVSDVELIDEFPARYPVNARREHRWTRGDWQLLPWLFSRVRNAQRGLAVNRISALGRWKILDNLRRSLITPVIFLVLLTFCAGLAQHQFYWIVLSCAAIVAPLVLSLASSVVSPPGGVSLRGQSLGLGRDLLQNTEQALFTICMIPHQAFLKVDAIMTTLWRVLFTRKSLLQWESAQHSDVRIGSSPIDFFREMQGGLIFTALFACSMLLSPQPQSLACVVLLIVWLLSPVIAWAVSRPIRRVPYLRSAKDSHFIRQIAWETWLYFEDSLTPAQNFLVPDNLQLVPTPVLAERTSPTNIGLSTLAVVAAVDLGFTTSWSAVGKLTGIFETLGRLERWKGHFLNWYQTRTLEPLSPRYVSAVDSGNFMGHLIALCPALQGFAGAPLLNANHKSQLTSALRRLLDGKEGATPSKEVADEIAALAQHLHGHYPRTLIDYAELLGVIRRISAALSLEAVKTSIVTSERERLVNFLLDLQAIAPLFGWIDELRMLEETDTSLNSIKSLLATLPPSLASMSRISREAFSLLEEMGKDRVAVSSPDPRRKIRELLTTSIAESDAMLARLGRVLSQAQEMRDAVQMRELYDNERKVFYIGYNVDTSHFDQGHYDLLASEARLGSLAAISRGQISQKHWFMLSRALTQTPTGRALVSWTGTMFEYLMPLLVTHDYPGTLLSESYRTVVRMQRGYAASKGVPWGISESGYAGVDFHKTYQYRAFGVPGLGLKRGLSDDLVISPYSTFLALSIEPRECLKNIAALSRAGAYGEYGFYEAIDYSPQRLTADENAHVVRAFFAHHQAMTLIAIDNFMHEGIMCDRFHSDVKIKSVELLLQERFPYVAPSITPHRAEQLQVKGDPEVKESREVELSTPHTRHPITYVLSNGNYSVLLDNAGGGYSFANQLALTRWKEDQILNNQGTFIYIKDRATESVWSTTFQPTRIEAESYEVTLSSAKAQYRRRDFGISSTMDVTVSREDNLEARRITLTNLTSRSRSLELTSYGEVALSSLAADSAHPAFSKMFVESEFLPDFDALLFRRRPRGPGDELPLLFHMVSLPVVWSPVTYDNSRLNFIGRGNTLSTPDAIVRAASYGQGKSDVADPIFSLRTRVELEPGESRAVSFVTGVAKSRAEVLSLVEKYREPGAVARAFELSESHSSVELRHEQFSIGQAHAFQRLANALFYNIPGLRAPLAVLEKSVGTQSTLWRFGISGDFPIVLVTLTDPSHLDLAKELLTAHEYLRLRGVPFDLVLFNEFAGGYMQEFQSEIDFLTRSMPHAAWVDRRAGIFPRNKGQLALEESVLLLSVARVVLHGARGSLESQIKLLTTPDILAPRSRAPISVVPSRVKTQVARTDLEFSNSFGGFVNNGHAYQIDVGLKQLPPMPWSNVVANKKFGFLITELGGGYTWSENSRENRLTAWSNDPVCDPASEVVYLKDLETGVFWSATPRPVPSSDFKVVHGFGFTTFEAEHQGISSALAISAHPEQSSKRWILKLTNNAGYARTLSVVLYVDWIIGVSREHTNRYLRSTYDETQDVLYVRNTYNNEFAGRIVAIGSDAPLQSFTTSRAEFLGRHREMSSPRALSERRGVALSKVQGAGLESCGAIEVRVALKPGESKEVTFFLSEHTSVEDYRSRVRTLRSKPEAHSQSGESRKFWDGICSDLQVKTPNRAFDVLMNGWLIYQTTSCRLLGRSAFYQSGGAFGFRDQLQDVLALLLIRPQMARQQIVLHASRQFVEGDVQHWWHPPTGRGVRTRISDDLLWLPYVVDRYIESTGDRSILLEEANFLEGPLLEPGHADSYLVPTVSTQRGTVFAHCLKAIELSLRFGAHGLPLMGSGDWNDGMNEVGAKGSGESVWLGWFLIDVLNRFSRLLDPSEYAELKQRYESVAKQVALAIEASAWDGDWYMRAFYDDGTPLGSSSSPECRIDSIAQSWSVLSGAAPLARQKRAMQSVYEHLVDNSNRLIKLLTPPFDHDVKNPGYIKGYLPGVRENGGQYTHAAAWVIMATARLGLGGKAHDLFAMINPINLSSNAAGVRRYKTEPYVMCGDVYANKEFPGHGGWSWYTGAAGWLFQVGLQDLLGIIVQDGFLRIEPCIPRDWSNYQVSIRIGETKFDITVHNPDKLEGGRCDLTLDGEIQPRRRINLAGLNGQKRVDAYLRSSGETASSSEL